MTPAPGSYMDITSLLAAIYRPGFQSLDSFCSLIGVKQENLLRFLYRNKTNHYISFPLKKKSGGDRLIKAPKKNLKILQRKLYTELDKFHAPKSSAHGFITSRSIKTNATPHVQKRYVFNIDLKDFFNSIHFGRVRNLFMAEPIRAPKNLATVLAQICCCEGRLPQGAPTSPLIANMIMRKLDSQLQALARENKCHYTRYADDLTFSFTCKKADLPTDLIDISESGTVQPGARLQSIIEKNGFLINPDKTRLKPYFQSQMVTGLIVNKFPNVPRDFIRRTRSMINALRRYGAVNAEAEYLRIEEKKSNTLKPRQEIRAKDGDGSHFISVLGGRINYIQMIRGKSDHIYRKLAYDFSVAIGKENKKLLKSPEEILGDSVFIVENLNDYSQGTAFLLDGIGLVTNAHVIDGTTYGLAPHSIEFYKAGEAQALHAELVYFDKTADLAIFFPGDDFKNCPRLTKSKKDTIRAQQPILSIGFPQHAKGASHYISKGYTVQNRRHIDMDLWLVDIPLVKGNSGGPIFNSSMEVIGIATKGSAYNDNLTVLYGFIPIATLNKLTEKKQYILSSKIHSYLRNSQFTRIKSICGATGRILS